MRLIDADALMAYCNNLVDKTIDANDIARFPTASGWISVKDKVPESNEIVLVSAQDKDGDRYHALAVRYPCGDWDSTDEYFNQWDGEVTHWMPLPEPPKEVTEHDQDDF